MFCQAQLRDGYTRIFLQFLPTNAHKFTLLPTMNLFLLKNMISDKKGKKLQFRHFYMLGNYVKLQTFFNPENRLPKHFNSSHVFEKSGPGPFLV